MVRLSPSEMMGGSGGRARARSREKDRERKRAGLPVKEPGKGLTKLTPAQQLFICWLIASYHKRGDAVKAFAERYPGAELTYGGWDHYNKTEKWKPIIEKLRDQYLNDLESLPLTQKKIRIIELTKLYEELDWVPDKMIEVPCYELDGETLITDDDGNIKTKTHLIMKKDTGQAASIIRQIAEEMNDIRGGEGIFIGDGSQVQIAIVRQDDKDANLDRPVGQKLLADGAIDLSPA